MYDKSMKQILRMMQDSDMYKVLNMLPRPGNKQKGKTCKEIASEVHMNTKSISIILQKAKRQHKAKCYHSKWRQTLF